MSTTSDFIIENGVLTKYVGLGGDIVIPDGVTAIGTGAFATREEGFPRIWEDDARVKSVIFPELQLTILRRSAAGSTAAGWFQ